MAEERRKKLAMLDSKRKTRNIEQMVITENLDELGMHDTTKLYLSLGFLMLLFWFNKR